MATDRELYGSARFTIAVSLLALMTLGFAAVVVIGLSTGEPSSWVPALFGAVCSAAFLIITVRADRRGRRNPLSWLPSGRHKGPGGDGRATKT